MIAGRLETGEEAELVAMRGETLSLVSPRAFAPGAPVRLTALLEEGELSLSGKSLGSKRRDDARFDVRARLISLRREERERLAAALSLS